VIVKGRKKKNENEPPKITPLDIAFPGLIKNDLSEDKRLKEV